MCVGGLRMRLRLYGVVEKGVGNDYYSILLGKEDKPLLRAKLCREVDENQMGLAQFESQQQQ